MIKYLVACYLFLGVIFTARADDPRLLCLNAGNTMDDAKCLNKELDKAKFLLSEYLTAAQQQIDKQNSGTPRIEDAQKIWLKYRDAHCGDVETYWEAGTYRYRAELTCDIEATRSRTHEIWSAYLRPLGTSRLCRIVDQTAEFPLKGTVRSNWTDYSCQRRKLVGD